MAKMHLKSAAFKRERHEKHAAVSVSGTNDSPEEKLACKTVCLAPLYERRCRDRNNLHSTPKKQTQDNNHTSFE